MLISLPSVCETPFLVEREEFINGYPVYSGLMVCPICRKIWATLSLETGEYKLFHEARTIPCEKHPEACHPDLRPVAGSLLDNFTANGYDGPLLDELPEPLVRREFELHMKSLLIKEMNL
jgi:hypothetical protein